MANWLGEIRDRVVIRSQVGKRKLDAAFTRRELDRKLMEVGERFLALASDGRVAVPEAMTNVVQEARELESRLAAKQAEIAELEGEES